MNVSIAMATYNGEKYLREQLASLARQTYPTYELVVSDDGSGDGTLGVLEEFRKHAPFRVTILANTQRLGYTDNFWRAVRRCGGDCIAFSDQDDVWEPAKLERCVAEMRDQQVGLVCHAFEQVDSDLRPLGKVFPRLNSPAVLRPGAPLPAYMCIAGCAMVARRSVVETVLHYWSEEHDILAGTLGERPIVGHDVVTVHVAHAMSNIVVLPTVLLRQRRHGQSVFAGARIPTSLSEFLTLALGTGSCAYRRASNTLRLRAQLYAAMASDDSVVAREFRQLAHRLQADARFCSRRADLYGAPTWIGRLSLWSKLLNEGCYRSRWGPAAKDLLLAFAGRLQERA